VEHAGDVAESAGLDRIDQGPHAMPARGRQIRILRRSAAALRNVGRGALFTGIDDSARKKGFASCGKTHPLGTA
jgi:hypothetical protein